MERISLVFQKICGHPLPPVGIFHGDLPSPGIPGNNHDYGEILQKIFPPLHSDTSEQPKQRHQCQMVSTHAVYKIPEAELIHYNLEHSVKHT